MMKCEICNYETDKKWNHTRHMNSSKHLKKVNGPVKKVFEITKKHHCTLCDVYVKDAYDLKRHTESKKHRTKHADEQRERFSDCARFPTNKQKIAIRKNLYKTEITTFDKPIRHSSRSKSKSNDGSDDEEPEPEPEPKPEPKKTRTIKQYLLKVDDYPEYLTLSANECLQKINYFTKFLISKNVELEDWINYSYLNKDDTVSIFDLYIEIYELVTDEELYGELIAL